MRSRDAGLCCLALIVGMSGCTVTATAPRVVVRPPEVGVAEVVVERPPPPVRVEEVPPPPAAHPESFVWQPGHWRWDGRDYEWHPGHYERRPARTAYWVAPEWVERQGRWVFRPGHWAYR